MKSERPKTSVFIATSIDGYIARKDGDINWLTTFSPPTNETEEKDCGFAKFYSSIDVLVLGRNSYQTVLNFDPWPYEGKRVIVLSSTLKSVSKKVELFSGDIHQLLKNLQADNVKHVYVDGGVTISRFMNADLIDHLTISIIPVVLGSGIPLFSDIHNDKWWSLKSSQVYSNGLVQLQYDFAGRNK